MDNITKPYLYANTEANIGSVQSIAECSILSSGQGISQDVLNLFIPLSALREFNDAKRDNQGETMEGAFLTRNNIYSMMFSIGLQNDHHYIILFMCESISYNYPQSELI